MDPDCIPAPLHQYQKTTGSSPEHSSAAVTPTLHYTTQASALSQEVGPQLDVNAPEFVPSTPDGSDYKDDAPNEPSLRKSGHSNIFIKNLDPAIDNKALHDTFSAFGNIVSCKVATENDISKGYGFVRYETAEAAEEAIKHVNGVLLNDPSLTALTINIYVGLHFPTHGRSIPTTLSVKNLVESMTDDGLRALFEPYGEVTSAVVSKDEDGKSRGFGFVNYADHEAATKAVDELHGKDMSGKALYVARNRSKIEREEELRRQYEKIREEKLNKDHGVNLYVKNLDDAIDDEKLRQEFSVHGTITSAKVMKDEKTETSKGFGFVCFSSPEEATNAVTEMNGRMLGSKNISVALAKSNVVDSSGEQSRSGSGKGKLPEINASVAKDQEKQDAIVSLELTVDIAANDDNSVCTLSTETMEQLKLFNGQFVTVRTTEGRESILIVLSESELPAGEEFPPGCIRINRVACSNLSIGAGDVVSVHACTDIKYGKRIHVLPIDDAVKGRAENLFDIYLNPYFSAIYRPVKRGDLFIVRGPLRAVQFKVVECDPAPYCIVTQNTIIYYGQDNETWTPSGQRGPPKTEITPPEFAESPPIPPPTSSSASSPSTKQHGQKISSTGDPLDVPTSPTKTEEPPTPSRPSRRPSNVASAPSSSSTPKSAPKIEIPDVRVPGCPPIEVKVRDPAGRPVLGSANNSFHFNLPYGTHLQLVSLVQPTALYYSAHALYYITHGKKDWALVVYYDGFKGKASEEAIPLVASDGLKLKLFTGEDVDDDAYASGRSKPLCSWDPNEAEAHTVVRASLDNKLAFATRKCVVVEDAGKAGYRSSFAAHVYGSKVGEEGFQALSSENQSMNSPTVSSILIAPSKSAAPTTRKSEVSAERAAAVLKKSLEGENPFESLEGANGLGMVDGSEKRNSGSSEDGGRTVEGPPGTAAPNWNHHHVPVKAVEDVSGAGSSSNGAGSERSPTGPLNAIGGFPAQGESATAIGGIVGVGDVGAFVDEEALPGVPTWNTETGELESFAP
ncbi:Protein phosphatase PP2A regulatory subunit B [Rhizophlyctis rosea]|nr:Protein phosphatase PP2A regulatory subunit B [Rhizophlyctis rosea]